MSLKHASLERLVTNPELGERYNIDNRIWIVAYKKQVSDDYWDNYGRAWSLPSGAPKTFTQSTSGSCSKDHPANAMCLIPVEFLKTEGSNEWGEICP